MSFVYLHASPAFARKGERQMALPRMDVPVTVVEWELFVPDEYRADRFGGSAIAAFLIQSHPPIAGLTETVSVAAEGPLMDAKSSVRGGALSANEPAGQAGDRGGTVNDARREGRDQYAAQAAAPSAKVQSLQRRAAGVLPVPIDVPRAGTSYRFIKPLAVDEETMVQFRYQRR